jgi:presenilin-like A22 family membrane protease
MRTRTQYVVVFIIFLTVHMTSLAFAPILYDQSFQAFEDPNDPVNPLIYIGMMLLFTAGLLVLIKFSKETALRLIFIVAVFFTLYIVFLSLTMYAINDDMVIALVPTALSMSICLALLKRPEWYIINLAGFILGFGSAAVLGVSFGILPSLILLGVLAIYDAISVYKTKHMITLAEGAMEMRLPILFIIPQKADFDMDDLNRVDLHDRSKDKERTTLMMGVGDAVIPGILVVSAAVSLSAGNGSLVYSSSALLVAFGTMLGAFLGFAALMKMVSSGRPQAGLPFLNGGAIAGFLLTHLMVYGNIMII